MPAIDPILPIVNHDNIQNSFDAKLRRANLWQCIEAMTALLEQL